MAAFLFSKTRLASSFFFFSFPTRRRADLVSPQIHRIVPDHSSSFLIWCNIPFQRRACVSLNSAFPPLRMGLSFPLTQVPLVGLDPATTFPFTRSARLFYSYTPGLGMFGSKGRGADERKLPLHRELFRSVPLPWFWSSVFLCRARVS